MDKIFIVGNTALDKNIIADTIVEKDSSLNIGRMFSSDPIYEDCHEESPIVYRNNEDICLDYKNNALLFVNSLNEYINYGITLDELYNKDIFCMSYSDFNNIAAYILKDENIVVLWVDNLVNGNINHADIRYAASFKDDLDRYNIKYLYFTGSDSVQDIANIALAYINGNDKMRACLEEEYS